MAALPLPSVPSLDNSYGSLFIGMVVAAGLWGIGTAQAYWYYTAYPNDPSALKMLVSVAWVVDTLHQALVTYLIYFYVVTNYFNPFQLDVQIWTFSMQSLFEIIPCFIVQSFFLMRIWRLSNKKVYLVVLPACFVVAKMVVAIVWIGLAFRIKSISAAEARFGYLSELANGLAAGGDILLGATMVYLLFMARTGIRQSDTMLAKLMIYTINTGAITSLCSIVTLIIAVKLNKTFIYGAFYFCISRLYINTMLASLNARQGLKEKSTDANAINMSNLTTVRFGYNSSRSGFNSGGTIRATEDGKSGRDPQLSVDMQDEFAAKSGSIRGTV